MDSVNEDKTETIKRYAGSRYSTDAQKLNQLISSL